MTTPIVQVRLNGGSWQSGGVDAEPGDTVELRLSNAAVFSTFRWEIYGYPTGFAEPTGWSTDADGVYYRLTATPESFDTLDAPSFGKYLVRCTCDGDEEQRDESTAVRVKSEQGLNGIAALETTQFSTTGGWAEDLKEDLEKLGKGVPYEIELSLVGVVGSTAPALFVLPKRFLITDIIATLTEAIVSGGAATVDVQIGWSGDNLLTELNLDTSTVVDTSYGLAVSELGSEFTAGNNYRVLTDQERTISANVNIGTADTTEGILKISLCGYQL